MREAEKTRGHGTRAAALALFRAVIEGRVLLSPLADDPAGPLAPLPPAERARARRLATDALRQVEPADRRLAPFLRKAPPPEVRAILRLAAVELAGGAAAHGVVNAAVALARADRRSASHAGLVNAVLRRLPPGPFDTPPQRLPRWLRQPLVHAWGREAVTAIEQVSARTPPLDLSFKPGAILPEGRLLPTGSLRIEAPGQVSALQGYAEGGWWVQDAAAALPARLLAPGAGVRVLDLCAAPGGKTLQMASAGARVTALDISAARTERLRRNLARTGLAADIVIADALTWQPEAPFDAILLDAPCSATGTIRRHPDLPFVKDETDLPGLIALQAALLDRALGWLAPGGRLVYATCSLLPDEGEGQIAAALARHPGLRVLPPDVPGMAQEWVTAQGGLRLRPDHWADQGGIDGFFMVALGLSPTG